MKKPQPPPDFNPLFAQGLRGPEGMSWFVKMTQADPLLPPGYLHWDELRHRPLPEGMTLEETWLATKLKRLSGLKAIPLLDKREAPFKYSVPDEIMDALHQVDMDAGGTVGMAHFTTPTELKNQPFRDQYLLRSLMRESITSSQLEGAVTTRVVAKEMLRTGRKPRDKSERMILNNFNTMRRITELRDQPLTPELVFELHRLIAEQTLEDDSAAGRFRREEEEITVTDAVGEVYHYPPPAVELPFEAVYDAVREVYHYPPPAVELPERLEKMCAFANGQTPGFFVHPVLRAMMLHFWLAYDHPFVDGNGRTARALFYWAMLRHGYWLFEFVSISEILVRAPAQYARAFLYTESDDNDLTYFLLHQTDVIQKAIQSLNLHIRRKEEEVEETYRLLRQATHLNHRQEALIGHALRHPNARYTVEGHRASHNTVYETARKDLLALQRLGWLEMKKDGKAFLFFPAQGLEEKVKERDP